FYSYFGPAQKRRFVPNNFDSICFFYPDNGICACANGSHSQAPAEMKVPAIKLHPSYKVPTPILGSTCNRGQEKNPIGTQKIVQTTGVPLISVHTSTQVPHQRGCGN